MPRLNLKIIAVGTAVAWFILWLNAQLSGFGAQIPFLGDFSFAGISAGSALILFFVLHFLKKWIK